jgi:peptidoglycan/LPS O-acetylase OafA/YrhL
LTTTTPKRQIKFINGLRGLAALIVAAGHIIGMVGPDHPVVPIWKADALGLVLWPWTFGGPAVWLFIMLSGFTLYWSEETRLISGRGATPFRVYCQRRLWRIVPTYYAALALGAVVVLGFGWILLAPSPSLQTYEPVTLGGIVSHLFMVHNLNPEWRTQVVPPLWSIAVEMQLYLLFPMLFLLRRKLTVYGVAAGLVLISFALNQVASFPIFELVEWFVVGSVLAHILRRRQVPAWAAMAVALVALAVGFARVPAISGRLEQGVWLVAFAALIAWMFAREGRRNLLESKPALWLGERSYSLYAVHFPIALLCWAFVGRLDLSRIEHIIGIVLLGMAASLAAASASYKWIEVPSLDKSRLAGGGKVSPATTRAATRR